MVNVTNPLTVDEVGIDKVIWNRRNLHNRSAELHEILSDCSHQ